MQKRLVVLGLAAALVGSGVVLGVMVPAASQQPGTRFTVCDRNRGGYSKDIDVGRKGFSPGDYFVEADQLRQPNTGARVGRVVLRGTIVRIFREQQDALFIIDVTGQFPKGKISGYGYGRFSNFRTGVKIAVTGGTGVYNSVRGAVLARNGRCGGKPGVRITFNLKG